MYMANSLKFISIHTSREGGDHNCPHKCLQIMISIHTSREGGDRVVDGTELQLTKFQSTPPAREVTEKSVHVGNVFGFQSTPPAREVTGQKQLTAAG